MSRQPTAFATALTLPWRECANGANGFPVSRGADPARVAVPRARNATMQGPTPLATPLG